MFYILYRERADKPWVLWVESGQLKSWPRGAELEAALVEAIRLNGIHNVKLLREIPYIASINVEIQLEMTTQ